MPADSAAASLEAPLAIAIQNGRRAARGNTGGRPGDRNVPCPIRSTERFRFAVIASPVAGVLQRPIEFTQDTSEAFRQLLLGLGVTCSMSRSGNVWDNSVMESFFSTLTTERVHNRRYATRDAARTDIVDDIERFYNPLRRHSTLGNISPVEFERAAGVA